VDGSLRVTAPAKEAYMIVLSVIVFFCLFLSGIAAFFFSWGAKDEIALADSEYAKQLYRSASSRLFANQWPIRTYALFTEMPPAKVAGIIKTLRALYAVFLISFGLFLACIVISAMTA
jgi:hypothetical protein